jgi:AmmeMemoRadiSam system protein A
MPEAHREEHAIEVQLPFLQEVLGTFTLVPLVVGRVSAEQVADVLERLWGGEETLIVISSDLSHYHPYEEASRIDRDTAKTIVTFSPSITHEQACGATPIAGALQVAQRKALASRLLDLRNSGDTAGGRSRVVGYGSFAFGIEHVYAEEHGRRLIALARDSIASSLAGSVGTLVEQGWLNEQRASFVTLKLAGRLRGCIGSLEASRRLSQDIAANARCAAFEDPRFPALTHEELDQTEIEISLLSRPARISFEDHEDLIRQLVPGEDGLILEHDGPLGRRRSTFLPQVWEDVRDPQQFVAQLKLKAGLAADTRTTRCRVKRYRVVKWREAQFAGTA